MNNLRSDCQKRMVKYNPIDIWRDREPLTNFFDWNSNVTDLYFRLDFLLSRAI